MFGSDILDTALGLCLLFLFMSLIASALRELIANISKPRGRDLQRGISEMLCHDRALIGRFYNHPIIRGLYRGPYGRTSRRLPSYIPSRAVSLAFLHIAAGTDETSGPLSAASLNAALSGQASLNPLQSAIVSLAVEPDVSIEDIRLEIEAWYDAVMDRVTGWYARRTRAILGVLGLGAAAAFNVDAITVAKHLAEDKALREALVARAGSAAAHQSAAELQGEISLAGLPIGWYFPGFVPYPAPQMCVVREQPSGSAGPGPALGCAFSAPAAIGTLAGWCITTLAIMLGAPFWFDVLNRLAPIRAAVKPEEKPAEVRLSEQIRTRPAE